MELFETTTTFNIEALEVLKNEVIRNSPTPVRGFLLTLPPKEYGVVVNYMGSLFKKSSYIYLAANKQERNFKELSGVRIQRGDELKFYVDTGLL